MVQLGTRVERSLYEQLNQSARKLEGYYSSYRRDGAIPGFIFKTREPAEKFLEVVNIALGVGSKITKPEPAPVNDAANPIRFKTSTPLIFLEEIYGWRGGLF